MDLRERFRLKVYESDGTQYEILFNSIMRLAVDDFKSVKPHGNIGDRGNDGWVQSTGSYYQVYAPEELFKNTKNAILKVKRDFQVLKGYWDDISRINSFYYVLNDKFQGVSPHISQAVESLKKEYNLVTVGVFSNDDLERELFKLPNADICSLLGTQAESNINSREDQIKAREFLDELSFIFEALFNSSTEAGYFFPANVFYFIDRKTNNDWEVSRQLCTDQRIAENQKNMWNQLISMFNQVSQDHYYEDIGLSFKYKPPYELVGRDQLIETRKKSMGKLIQNLADSYVVVRDFSLQ
ncbi:hypothetical protein [Leucothrix arctica]|uniref:Uncharacterized protein n=1 Tax=Leucothrix arctica TaxID=1481894 RepID=A0A317CHA3_9GAMM|nr:hypothetical protein [Leucothrix arctica]PWQ96783.1 hypothetical protein DKT75_08425 [Leucothrix arctica]